MDIRSFCASLFLFCLCTTFAIGQPAIPPQTPSTKESAFNPVLWQQALSSLEARVSTTQWTNNKINDAINAINFLQKNAYTCVKKTQAELKDLELVMVAVPTGTSTATKAAQVYSAPPLDEKTTELINLETACHLFLLHSEDVITQLEKIQQTLITAHLFTSEANLLENITALYYEPFSMQFNYTLFWASLGFEYFNNAVIFTFFFLLAVIGIISYFFHHYCQKLIQSIGPASSLLGTYKTLSRYFPALLLTGALAFFMGFLSTPYFNNGLAKISLACFIYLALICFTQILFDPLPPAKPLIARSGDLPFLLKKRLFYFFSFSLLCYLIFTLLAYQLLVPLSSIGKTFYILISSVLLMRIILPVTQPSRLYHPFLLYSLVSLFFFIFCVIIITDCIGYVFFALFLFKNLVITLSLLFLLWIITIFLRNGVHFLEQNIYVRHYLGVSVLKNIPELYLVKIFLLVIIWSILIGVLLKTWSFELYYEKYADLIVNGFTFAGLFILPSRLLFAVLVFVVLSLMTRLLQAYVSRQNKLYIEQGAQVALASILGYLGFFIALIIALVITGINLTNLAIIAGALSVGIGFGLQNIINNFISGLILLIETPIRPGDRIIVGDIEGFVKRIHLRATQVVTLRGSDVFIPNAELVSKSVTNLMFRDPRWWVVCNVGVAYGSDIPLVKKILLDIAARHPQVVKEESSAPTVFLQELGNSAINFSLSCMIQHVNMKKVVETELYTQIIQDFEKHGISIPFSQQDIRIKEWPQ